MKENKIQRRGAVAILHSQGKQTKKLPKIVTFPLILVQPLLCILIYIA